MSVQIQELKTPQKLFLRLYSLVLRCEGIVWRLFGRTIRRRAIAPLWKRFLLTLEMVKSDYPDSLSTIVDEACQEFIEGKYFSSVMMSSSAVEWVLISELKRSGKNTRGLSSRIENARGLLPINELFDRNEIGHPARNSVFVLRRNAVDHGDMHGIPHRQGLVKSKLPFGIFYFEPYPVTADDAFDQLSKALRFLIKWRIQAIHDG